MEKIKRECEVRWREKRQTAEVESNLKTLIKILEEFKVCPGWGEKRNKNEETKRVNRIQKCKKEVKNVFTKRYAIHNLFHDRESGRNTQAVNIALL